VIDTPYPEDLLFIEKNIYDQELPLEHALCCEQLGKRNDMVQAGEACPNDLTLPSQPAAS